MPWTVSTTTAMVLAMVSYREGWLENITHCRNDTCCNTFSSSCVYHRESASSTTEHTYFGLVHHGNHRGGTGDDGMDLGIADEIDSSCMITNLLDPLKRH